MLTTNEPKHGELERATPPPAPGLGAFGSMRISDVTRGIARYRGVAFTALAIVIASAILPGPKVIGGNSGVSSQSPGATGVSQGTDLAVAPEAPGVGGVLAPTAEVSSFDDQPSRVTTFSSATEAFGPSLATDDSADSTGTAGARTSDTVTSQETTTTAPTPLRVVKSAWSTRTAGTPLASEGVPSGTLPVGKRVGQDDKLSFVQLAGNDVLLKLRIGPPEGQRNPEDAALQLCPITSASWAAGEAMSFDADPQFDCAKAIAGTFEPGMWIFDLSSVKDIATSSKGFAIVPVGSGVADFQVAFQGRG